MKRIAIAEALAADPRRDPGEVLADVGHSADFLMRQARQSVKAGEPTPQLLELTEAAGRWARISLDAGLAERQTRVVEQDAAILAAVVSRILGRLHLTAEQQALVPVVVPDEMRAATVLAIDGESP